MYFVYVLQSQSTGRFYVGHCDDLIRRYREHAFGKNLSTRNRGPWTVPYYEVHSTRAEAAARERQIKSWKSARAIQQLLTQA